MPYWMQAMSENVILYKLTDQNHQTGHRHVLTTWRKGFRPPRLSGEGPLCGSGWHHAYDHSLLAVLHNPIHADFEDPRCYKIKVHEDDIGRHDGQMKVGFAAGETLEEIDLPKVTTEQQVRYAIGIAVTVYPHDEYLQWATGWIDGTDRTGESASRVARAAWAAKAEWAARAAERAAEAAERAARAAEAAEEWAAAQAANAANAARNIDLLRIAEWAVTDEGLDALLEASGE
jgi:hypothetical protein